ncbi:uncharacterized protein LOC131943216 isoform X2 [Physella acuta]|uniref:uncharacterized protein LOC131943216 isoform X2 n=1 Tax=Physella acuta TaxID=109671 RepID=UPI0027DC093B|nr:uncharacterized protein LOC131943216 isoform X2 [Physella acuta]
MDWLSSLYTGFFSHLRTERHQEKVERKMSRKLGRLEVKAAKLDYKAAKFQYRADHCSTRRKQKLERKAERLGNRAALLKTKGKEAGIIPGEVTEVNHDTVLPLDKYDVTLQPPCYEEAMQVPPPYSEAPPAGGLYPVLK